jgi:hypothetical protein
MPRIDTTPIAVHRAHGEKGRQRGGGVGGQFGHQHHQRAPHHDHAAIQPLQGDREQGANDKAGDGIDGLHRAQCHDVVATFLDNGAPPHRAGQPRDGCEQQQHLHRQHKAEVADGFDLRRRLLGR